MASCDVMPAFVSTDVMRQIVLHIGKILGSMLLPYCLLYGVSPVTLTTAVSFFCFKRNIDSRRLMGYGSRVQAVCKGNCSAARNLSRD